MNNFNIVIVITITINKLVTIKLCILTINLAIN